MKTFSLGESDDMVTSTRVLYGMVVMPKVGVPIIRSYRQRS